MIKSSKFKENNNNNIVFFVMHADFIDLLLKQLMNIKEDSLKFTINNTSTSLFILNENDINIKFINNTEHLLFENIHNKIINRL